VHFWKSLWEESALYLQQQKAQQDFERIREAHESLSRFSCADDLLRFLHDSSAGDPEEKNVLLGAIIRCAHDDAALLPTVRALLFVAMFPALDRVFSALLPHARNTREPEAKLTNDIFWAFHREITQWDFEARNRVAATLQLNVRRKVKKKYVDEVSANGTPTVQAPDNSPTGMKTIWEQIASPESMRADFDASLLKDALRARFSIKPTDCELIVGRLVCNVPFAELAQQLGIKEENARQRFRRALNRLRKSKNSQP